ncbi:uncharacterized protein LOC141884794 isoform X3 [Acropora palmata]|uniref:uncharacterized protein LOC141884794 isoform X3 n=1 Tax=Acropora palmata TaxID=6131 RepID=UPI003DA1924A
MSRREPQPLSGHMNMVSWLLCFNNGVSYAETYQWEGQCSTLVEKMLEMIKETSTAPDQAVAAVNLGEQGPSSLSESVSNPDATTIKHVVGDAVSSGRGNGRQGVNAGIPENPVCFHMWNARREINHQAMPLKQDLMMGLLIMRGDW